MQYVNRAKHLVFLPLNTGDRLHLAPNEVSRQLEKFETDRNSRLDRLVELGVIEAIADAETEKKPSARAPKATTST